MVIRDMAWIWIVLLSPILALVPLNMYLQYYLVTHVPPGFPSPRAMALSPHGPVTSPREKWLSLESASWFRPETWGLTSRGRSGEEREGLMSEGRRVRRCRKCDGPKPEVRGA